MDIFLSFFQLLQKSLFAIGPFILLLGVLIFIHELGHFLVARYFGVKVEVFSLGFGPKILKYKKGDTVYCISLLPLGGYVKMYGDNPLKEVPDSEKSKGFLYKSVPQKWLIAFGGPFMNLIFTVLAFWILALTGIPSFKPQLGDIQESSKAYKAGFRSGDQILSVNDKPVSYYNEVSQKVRHSPDEPLFFKVLAQDNKEKMISAATTVTENLHPGEWKKSIREIEGLTPLSRGLRIGVIYDSPAYRAGLRTFDKIEKINNKDFKYWRDLEAFIETTDENVISITLKRDLESKHFSIEKKSLSSLSLLGIEPAELYIYLVGPDTPARQAGLLKGDRLLVVDGKIIKDWDQVLDTITAYSGKPFSITYRREGEKHTVSISPKDLFVEGNIKKRYMIGIAAGGELVLPEGILKKHSAFQALIYSGKETWKWLEYITVGVIRLIQGEISIRNLGGPVRIGRMAHSSFQAGFNSFLLIMAIISLNLFFLNLLPIPMLDGGHLLFFTIEGILGRPLSMKKLIVAQQVGLFLLLSFFGFVMYNDIYIWFKSW